MHSPPSLDGGFFTPFESHRPMEDQTETAEVGEVVDAEFEIVPDVPAMSQLELEVEFVKNETAEKGGGEVEPEAK